VLPWVFPVANETASQTQITDLIYPICSKPFGAQDAKVSALELGVLSYYAYASPSQIQKNVEASFKHRTAKVLNISTEASPAWFAVRFPAKAPTTTSTIVIAVRGTHNTLDLSEDASIYAAIAMLQAASYLFIPLLSMVPAGLTRRLLNLLTSDLKDHLIDRFLGNVASILNAYPDDKLVLSGHSLGGMFAEVAAVRHGLDTLVFSAPGIGWMRNALLKETEATEMLAMKSYTVIVPEHDLVPKVDVHLGNVQPILCNAIDEYILDKPVSRHCHNIQRSVCELRNQCGDMGYHFNCTRYIGDS